MANVRLVMLSDCYRLEVGEDKSEEVDYGVPVHLVSGGKTYIGFIDLDQKGDPETPLPDLVYCGTPIEAQTIAEDSDAEPEPEEAESV